VWPDGWPDHPAEPAKVSAARVLAAGGLLWRPAGADSVEVALVHRPRYDDWSLPKGKLEVGESSLVGACREVLEETGFRVRAGRTLGESRYRVVSNGREMPKTVRWWAMRALDGQFAPGREVDRLVWLPPARARRRLTAGRDAAPLDRFLSGPAHTRTLLLVRHGSAGDRESWPGNDDARPLDDSGRAQAEALAGFLGHYCPEQLVSAPLGRCVDTLRPLADAHELPIELDPALGERAHAQDASRVAGRLRALQATDRVTVACSQGGVIPQAVDTLAAESGLDLGSVNSRKGSLWALSFDAAGRLVDADYTASPLP